MISLQLQAKSLRNQLLLACKNSILLLVGLLLYLQYFQKLENCLNLLRDCEIRTLCSPNFIGEPFLMSSFLIQRRRVIKTRITNNYYAYVFIISRMPSGVQHSAFPNSQLHLTDPSVYNLFLNILSNCNIK